MSDDSHGVDQVGTHYDELLRFDEETGIEELIYFERKSTTLDSGVPDMTTIMIPTKEVMDIWSSSR